MNGLGYHRRARSLGAQIARMQGKWSGFTVTLSEGMVCWTGSLRPIQRPYIVDVWWRPNSDEKPYVVLSDPKLAPRADGDFENIPHLLFYAADPAFSGLCLFDPDGAEWSNRRLIADTTIPWASEWLYHYEFWLEDGSWKGASVGYESIAEARAASIHRQASQLAEDTAAETSVAKR